MRNVHGLCLGPRHLRTPLFHDDLFDRVHETRLAQTGFPNDRHHLTHPFLSLLPAISEQAYFGITTGQRSERDWRWRMNPTSSGRALLRSHELFGRIHNSIKDQSSPDVGVGPARFCWSPGGKLLDLILARNSPLRELEKGCPFNPTAQCKD